MDVSHAEGSYNVSLNGTEKNKQMQHMVGIGENTNNLKNAHTIMANGDHYVIGVGGYQGTESTEEAFDNIKTLQAIISEMVQLSDTAPSSDASEASAGTAMEAARADHVHPFAPGDIQNPKSMDGANMEQLIIPGFYYGVPQYTGVGNPPTITDRAVLQVSYMDNKSTRTVLQVLFPDGNTPYYRTNPMEAWSDWKPLAETDLTGTAAKPVTFASGDLDTLTRMGMYVLTSDILSDYTNFPPVPTGYTPYYPVLYVYNSGGIVSQTISVNHGDNKLYNYCRNNQSGTFGDWTGGAVGGGISYVYEIATLDPYDGNGSEDAGGTVVINTPYKENQIIEVAMNTTGLGTGKSLTFRVLRSTEEYGSMTVTVPPVDTFDDKGSIHFTVADLNPTTGNNPVLLSWWFSLDNA